METDEIVRLIRSARSASEDKQEQDLDNIYSEIIIPLGKEVLENPDPANIHKWILIQYECLSLYDENVVDITAELFEHQKVKFIDVLQNIPDYIGSDIRILLAGVSGPSPESDYLSEVLNIDRFEVPDRPDHVLCEFVAENVLRPSRAPIYQGFLTIYDNNNNPVGRFRANTGGTGNSFRVYGGPIPPGIFRVSNYRSPRKIKGMTVGKASYSFNLDAVDGTRVYGTRNNPRGLFRIHPDGGGIGTLGCIGIYESDDRALECADILNRNMVNSISKKLYVNYDRILSGYRSNRSSLTSSILKKTDTSFSEDVQDLASVLKKFSVRSRGCAFEGALLPDKNQEDRILLVESGDTYYSLRKNDITDQIIYPDGSAKIWVHEGSEVYRCTSFIAGAEVEQKTYQGTDDLETQGLLELRTEVPAEVVAGAQNSKKIWNIPVSVSLAQWALESGWGRHMPSGSNNPFGIKATGSQPYVLAKTKEYRNGHITWENAKFRKFDSISDAFDAHSELIATDRRYHEVMRHADDPDRFASALTGIYATDPNYGSLLKKIMRSSNLYKYDT